MKPGRQENPERIEQRIERRVGGGIWLLVGTFMLVAATVLVWQLWAVPWALSRMVVPALLALGGVIVLFARRRKRIDAEHRTIRDTWTLFGDLWDRRWSFDDFDCIEITEERRQSDRQSYTVYPVRFVGKSRFLWMEDRSYSKSRKAAEEIARVTGLAVHDSSGGATSVRLAHELDQSLRDRVRARGDGMELPPRPAELQSSVALEGDRVAIEIPGASTTRRFAVPMLIIFLGACGVLIYVATFFDAAAEDARRRLFLLVGTVFVLTPFLLFVAIFLMMSPRGARVTASPDGLEIRRKNLFGRTRFRLASSRIEDIALPDMDSKKGIVVRSDRKIVTFGENLSHEEKAYLLALVRAVVTV